MTHPPEPFSPRCLASDQLIELPAGNRELHDCVSPGQRHVFRFLCQSTGWLHGLADSPVSLQQFVESGSSSGHRENTMYYVPSTTLHLLSALQQSVESLSSITYRASLNTLLKVILVAFNTGGLSAHRESGEWGFGLHDVGCWARAQHCMTSLSMGQCVACYHISSSYSTAGHYMIEPSPTSQLPISNPFHHPLTANFLELHRCFYQIIALLVNQSSISLTNL